MNGEIQKVDSDSRKELLAEQFSAIEAEAPAPEAAPEPATEAEAAQSAADRARDAAGRFAKAEAAAKAPKAAPAGPQATAPEAPEPVEEPVWKRPPQSWKKEMHDFWSKADPRLQEYAYQREEQMRAGIEPIRSKAEFADKVNEAIAPYMDTIRGLGIDPPQAIRALMEADNILRSSSPQDRLNYFHSLARSYGIDLTAQGQPAPQAPVDPNFVALQNELVKIRGEVTGWKQAQEEAAYAALLDEVQQFSTKAEHFEAARKTMIPLMESGIATTLEDAYDKALRLDPELFAASQQAQQAAAAAQRKASADKAAKAARAAAVSVRGSTPGAPAAKNSADRRSLLAEQFDGLSERL
jgi:hypothetical protein